MSINSAAFLLFLAAAAAFYYLTPKKWRYLVLLAASAFFYLSYSVKAAVYLLFTIAATYGAAMGLGAMHRAERTGTQGAGTAAVRRIWLRRRRLLLAGVLALNFATLALFKYLDSWLGTANSVLSLLGLSFRFRPLELLLPLGISFYIFQTSGYLIDVYRGKAKPERSFLKYALFVSWFPQMIQGPINRFGALQSQLTEGNDFSADQIKYGVQLMLWGILKKLLLADTLAPAVAEVFDNFTKYSGAVILLAVVLYCLQLYCDFSGGTDLVRGASQLFGVEMMENFRRPYFARTVDDFWRRWHISLGEWMKDYLFYPLALSRPLNRLSKKLRPLIGVRLGKLAVPCVSTVVVFLMVGVWQGPGLSNIAYGLWNGGLMSLAMLAAPAAAKARERLNITDKTRWFHAFQVARTFMLVVVGRYFSRADRLSQALRMLKRTVFSFGWSSLDPGMLTSFGLTPLRWGVVLASAAALAAVSVLQERGIPIRKALETRHWAIQFAVLFIGVLVVYVFLSGDYIPIGYVYENI